MTTATARVLLFEDDPNAFDKLNAPLCRLLAAEDAVLDRFTNGQSSSEGNVVESAIKRSPIASLVVLDWDLTKYANAAVTRQMVRGTVEELYVPLCTYTAPTGEHGMLQRLMKWDDNVIALDSTGNYESIAKRCAAIASGFLKLERARQPSSEAKTERLSQWITAVLDTPATAQSQVAEYAMANLQRLLQAESLNAQERARLRTTVVGYWIYNQLLQFPGVLVNEIAAASYLDIAKEDFGAPEVRAVFSDAKYGGPFADVADYWWLAGLDKVCAGYMRDEDTSLLTGGEAVARKLGRSVGHVKCSAGHDGAGYYCLITREPVCDEHSVRPGTWLPIGADRSRIEKRKYDELSPWLAD